jgi:DNA-binding XRE family transcriptional regulator
VISPTQLQDRFEKIEGLLDTISATEAELDALLGAAGTPSLVTIPPPPSPKSGKISPRSEEELAAFLAGRITAKRRARGWRQQDLADATGIARPNIARLESGRRMPKVSTLHRIAQALEIAVEELME